MRLPWPTVLLLLAALLAGCTADEGDGPGGGHGDGGGTTAGPTDSDDAGEVPDAAVEFAVLVANGRLEGEGPEPGSVAACSIAAADGGLDVEAKQAWARPGQHSFKVGSTWLLVVDEVEVDDPRSVGCVVRTVTPFTATGNWQPQVGDGAFSLEVSPDGDRLLVSRNAVAPGDTFESHVVFEDGDYTFTGDLRFTHAGWWPAGSFEEREEEGDEGAPPAAEAAWWD